jgi:hypothetical protein
MCPRTLVQKVGLNQRLQCQMMLKSPVTLLHHIAIITTKTKRTLLHGSIVKNLFGMERRMRDREKVMFILQEECAEVIQAISKIYRFGLDTEWEGVTNKQAFVRELGDVLAVIEVLLTETDINIDNEDLENALDAKKKKLDIYLPVE